MSHSCECPKCGADISDSWQEAEWDVGISAGWFCDACSLGVSDDGDRGPVGEDDVGIPAAPRNHPDGMIGTPISELSGRPGQPGFAEFCRIAKTYGYD